MGYKLKLTARVSDEDVEKGHLPGNDLPAETILSEVDLTEAKAAAEALIKVGSSATGELYDQQSGNLVSSYAAGTGWTDEA